MAHRDARCWVLGSRIRIYRLRVRGFGMGLSVFGSGFGVSGMGLSVFGSGFGVRVCEFKACFYDFGVGCLLPLQDG